MEKEIFRAGTWVSSNGVKKTYTVKDLDDIAAKFNESTKFNNDGKRVPLTQGHPPDNAPAFGWLGKVKRVKDRLVGEFEDVLDCMKEWIKQKSFREVSIALNKTGGLRHVGILGGVPPAVPGLGEWKFEDNGDYAELTYTEHKPNKENTMELAEALAKVEALKSANESLKAEFEATKTKVTELEAKVTEAEEAIEAASKKYSEKETEYNNLVEENQRKEQEYANKADADFVDNLIKEKKLRPAEKEITLINMKAHRGSAEMEFSDSDGKKVKKTPLEMYKETLSNAQELIETGEQFIDGVDKPSAKESKLVRLVEEYANKHNCTYSEASGPVLAAHPEFNFMEA